MKKSANIIIPLLIVGALTPFTAKALTATSSGSVSNNFMFIENAIDGEGNDSNLLIVFYVQIMPDDFVMQLHRF